MMLAAVAGERPSAPRDTKPVGELGSSPVVPSNPNSRLGRQRSPLAQGRDRMDAIVVGIDVSKDRLDVEVRPTGEAFVVARDAEGLDSLIARLLPLAPAAIAVEATGGYETVVAASLAAVGLGEGSSHVEHGIEGAASAPLPLVGRGWGRGRLTSSTA